MKSLYNNILSQRNLCAKRQERKHIKTLPVCGDGRSLAYVARHLVDSVGNPALGFDPQHRIDLHGDVAMGMAVVAPCYGLNVL